MVPTKELGDNLTPTLAHQRGNVCFHLIERTMPVAVAHFERLQAGERDIHYARPDLSYLHDASYTYTYSLHVSENGLRIIFFIFAFFTVRSRTHAEFKRLPCV